MNQRPRVKIESNVWEICYPKVLGGTADGELVCLKLDVGNLDGNVLTMFIERSEVAKITVLMERAKHVTRANLLLREETT